MQLPRPRITLRWMMIAVAVLGVVAWLATTAVRVAYEPHAEQMSHLRQRGDTREYIVQTHPIVGVFWPRYWRRLLGRPWPGSYVCPSCREAWEIVDGHPLIDLASSDDSAKMDKEITRLNQAREDVGIDLKRKPSSN